MPFESKAQQRWMYAKHPEMAAEWAQHTDFKHLPERVQHKYAHGGRVLPDIAGKDPMKEALRDLMRRHK